MLDQHMPSSSVHFFCATHAIVPWSSTAHHSAKCAVWYGIVLRGIVLQARRQVKGSSMQQDAESFSGCALCDLAHGMAGSLITVTCPPPPSGVRTPPTQPLCGGTEKWQSHSWTILHSTTWHFSKPCCWCFLFSSLETFWFTPFLYC